MALLLICGKKTQVSFFQQALGHSYKSKMVQCHYCGTAAVKRNAQHWQL